MSSSNIEDIIGSLYDMVQDARTMPLAADKCILERDRVLDMLDEVIAQMPGELKQARTIVESRNDLINQARREAEGILRQAQDQAAQLVTKEAIYEGAKKRSEELVAQTQERIDQIRKAGNDYMAESLRRTEEVISQALHEVQDTRMKFTAVTESQEQRAKQMPCVFYRLPNERKTRSKCFRHTLIQRGQRGEQNPPFGGPTLWRKRNDQCADKRQH